MILEISIFTNRRMLAQKINGDSEYSYEVVSHSEMSMRQAAKTSDIPPTLSDKILLRNVLDTKKSQKI
jgi:hypothetical protein